MRLSNFTSTPRATAGHWVLTGVAIGLLSAVFAFLWWFGPEYADMAFVLWALGSVPLLLAAYSRTRSRALLATATLLLLAPLAAVPVYPYFNRLERLAQIEAVTVMFAALPFLVTAAWLGRLHIGIAHRGVQARRGGGIRSPLTLVAAGVVVIGAAARWYHNAPRYRVVDPSGAARYAGCYELRLGRWVPSHMLRQGVEGIMPERLRLDTERGALLSRRVDERQYYRYDEVGQRLIRPGWWGAAYWEPLEDGRVRLNWTTGAHGVTMELRWHGDDLRGIATVFSDFVGPWPEPTARVRAIRVDCGGVSLDTVRSAPRPPT